MGLMTEHSHFSMDFARLSKPYLSARSSSSTAVCRGKNKILIGDTMLRGTGYVYAWKYLHVKPLPPYPEF